MLDEPLLGPWDLFALCPSCRRNGEIRAVRLGGQQKTITYWCADCQRSWNVTGTDEERSPQSEPPADSPPSADAK